MFKQKRHLYKKNRHVQIKQTCTDKDRHIWTKTDKFTVQCTYKTNMS